MKTRDGLGRFKRTLKVWDGSDWNDGWIDNRGRFRVYRPDYPRAYSNGHALRAHVVWWITHGQCHPKGTALHHRNGIKTDDIIENLEIMKHGEHTAYHSRKIGIELICEGCCNPFRVPAWRIKSRQKDGHRIRFCSLSCRNITPLSESHKRNISRGLKHAYETGHGPSQRQKISHP